VSTGIELRQGLSKEWNRERARILSKRAHRTTRRVAPRLNERARGSRQDQNRIRTAA
jgi:hypothetical protein